MASRNATDELEMWQNRDAVNSIFIETASRFSIYASSSWLRLLHFERDS